MLGGHAADHVIVGGHPWEIDVVVHQGDFDGWGGVCQNELRKIIALADEREDSVALPAVGNAGRVNHVRDKMPAMFASVAGGSEINPVVGVGQGKEHGFLFLGHAEPLPHNSHSANARSPFANVRQKTGNYVIGRRRERELRYFLLKAKTKVSCVAD